MCTQGVCLLPPSNYVLLTARARPGEVLRARVTAVRKGGACWTGATPFVFILTSVLQVRLATEAVQPRACTHLVPSLQLQCIVHDLNARCKCMATHALIHGRASPAGLLAAHRTPLLTHVCLPQAKFHHEPPSLDWKPLWPVSFPTNQHVQQTTPSTPVHEYTHVCLLTGAPALCSYDISHTPTWQPPCITVQAMPRP